jgi:hypothetical protein
MMRMRVPGFLLRDRVEIEHFEGSGAYGDVLVAPVTVKAHVEPTNRLVIDTQGQTVRAEAVMILRPEDGPVPVGSVVNWGGKKFRVLQAGGLPDEVRPTHREVLIG